MSHSVPSDSSTIDTTFLVGRDLVEFNRPDLPIYASLESCWDDGDLDSPDYGAPLDRLFGEPGEVFVSGLIGAGERASALAAAQSLGEDPLVVLGGLSDGLILPTTESTAENAFAMPSGAHHAPEIVTIFDVGIDSFAAVHLHDGASWDPANGAWAFDYST
jgi:hypothetical protein